MGARRIAIANMKGGVGKTTMVVSLAEALAAASCPSGPKQVLVIDLDGQANASFCLAGDALLSELIEAGDTIDAFLSDTVIKGRDRDFAELVRDDLGVSGHDDAPGSVSLVATSPQLRLYEREMITTLAGGAFDPERLVQSTVDVVRNGLASLDEAFDYIIFDCPPGISTLSEAALRLADLVVVPTTPTTIASLGLETFCKTVNLSHASGEGEQRLPWVLANMVQKTRLERRTLPKDAAILVEMRAEAGAEDGGFRMFATEVPNSPELEDAAQWQSQTALRDRTYLQKYGPDMTELMAGLIKELESVFADAEPDPAHA